MTGGYHDARRSRLDAMKKFKNWRGVVGDLEDKSAKSKAQVNELHQRVNIVSGEVQRLEVRRAQDLDSYQAFKV